MHPFLTDFTRGISYIAYSDAYVFNNVRCIDVVVVTYTGTDFLKLKIQMPFCTIKDIYGMSKEQIDEWTDFAKAHFGLIQKLSYKNEQKKHKNKKKKHKDKNSKHN